MAVKAGTGSPKLQVAKTDSSSATKFNEMLFKFPRTFEVEVDWSADIAVPSSVMVELSSAVNKAEVPSLTLSQVSSNITELPSAVVLSQPLLQSVEAKVLLSVMTTLLSF